MNLGLINAPRLLVITGLTGALMGCTVFLQQSLYAQNAPLSEKRLTVPYFPQLPPAKQKVTVAVDKFRNLEDQYKQIGTGQTGPVSSTAITPNHTNILLSTLEESGWFLPIEYGNIVRLLSNTQSNGAPLKTDEKLPPVPSATIFLEGGIVSYDANVFTDEDGIQFFSAGRSTQYQQDRVTVYLRAISIRTGEILKTIYISRTILSQPVNASTFRYISFKRPREAETGLTSIPPDQLAVKEAIKKAVQGLIIEGIRDGLWLAADLPAPAMTALINTYEQEKMDMSETDMLGGRLKRNLFGSLPKIDAPFISVHPYVGIMRYSGDYTRRDSKGAYGISVEMYLTPALGVQVNAATGTMASQDAFSVNLTSLEGNLVLRPLPSQHWTPLLYGGFGVVSRSRSTPFQLYGTKYGQAQGGIGVQFSPNRDIGFRSTLSYNQPFTDSLDGQILGAHKDFYTRITVGLVIHIGHFQPKAKPIIFAPVAPQTK